MAQTAGGVESENSTLIYPNLTVTVNNNPSPGHLFLGPTTNGLGHLMILDNELTPLFYKKVTGNVFDFKLQPNGKLTYNIYSVHSYGMNNSGITDKQYITPLGFALDIHDLQVMGDGTYYVFGRDHITIDMSQYVAGGDTAAILIAHTIHHMDADDNELWRWHSFEHYDIFDADEFINLTHHTIDWTHCNSIEVDHEGNLIISTRNFNEITKISRQTGEIIWRLGGERNQFQFINDNRGFRRQHDARILSNGNLALFDNGHMLIPQYSSYVEYEIDEQNFKATLIRRYSRGGSIYSPSRGGIQELSNGNIAISWDDLSNPFVSEINPGDTTEYEVRYDAYAHQYRAYKFPWKSDLFSTDYDSLDFGVVTVGNSASIDVKLYNVNNDIVTINEIYNRDSSFYVYEYLPKIIPPHDSIELTIMFEPIEEGRFTDKINFRSATDTLLITQQVFVEGTTYPVSVEDEITKIYSYSLSQNYPNPFNPSTNIKYQIFEAGLVSLKIYDVLGNEIVTLVDEEKPAGLYEVNFNSGSIHQNISSGIYFYQLKAGNFIQTKKMLLIK
ncbi:MAG: T9SS type A sorting domain-containing protein [Ignavibacteriaceae bacterium]|nr:T9SS type A sorting domain-containing protein [Ignavibacteriaceae bacterium]